MDLSQVRYFNAVARHGSFSAAAKALGITQPGLTKAVRRLEASLDCMLFTRLPRGVVLTQQGEALLRHASLLDVQIQDARKEVRALAGGAVGELRIGAGPSWLSRALPRIVAELTAEYPQLSFHVVGGYNSTLMESLSSGESRSGRVGVARPYSRRTAGHPAHHRHHLGCRPPQPSAAHQTAAASVEHGRLPMGLAWTRRAVAISARRIVPCGRTRAASRQDRIRLDLLHCRSAA